MKILFFSDHFHPEPSAPAAHVYERALAWAKAGHAVTVVTAAPNFPEGRVYPGYKNAWRSIENLDGVRVVRVKTYMARNEGFFRRTLDYISYMVASFSIAFFEDRPDVVVSTSPHLFTAIGGVLHAKLRRVPHVFELRDLWPATIAANTGVKKGMFYRVLESIELSLYRNSRRILAFTNSFKRDLVGRGIPAEKIDVVINGANLSLFSPAQQRDAKVESEFALRDCFVIGYIGTLGLSQGLENVIEAATLLNNSKIKIFFVGVGAARETLEKMVATRVLSNVVFAPRQPKNEIARFWSVCNVSLVHLKNDPVFATVIPSKIFESMAMGLPMLYCGPQGEGSDIVMQRQAGLFVPPGDPAALARAMQTLQENPALVEQFARNSAAAASEYSRDRQAQLSLNVFQKAAGQG